MRSQMHLIFREEKQILKLLREIWQEQIFALLYHILIMCAYMGEVWGVDICIMCIYANMYYKKCTHSTLGKSKSGLGISLKLLLFWVSFEY